MIRLPDDHLAVYSHEQSMERIRTHWVGCWKSHLECAIYEAQQLKGLEAAAREAVALIAAGDPDTAEKLLVNCLKKLE